MEYFPWYIDEKVGKRLKNINENPILDDVLKNTLDKHALCKFNAGYERNNASESKTISNEPTWLEQISKSFKP